MIGPAGPANSLNAMKEGRFFEPVGSGDKAKEEFLAYVEKTPGQRMRDTILGQMGLTEEALTAMDEKPRKELEEKIQEMIREKIEKALAKSSGELPAAMLVSFDV